MSDLPLSPDLSRKTPGPLALAWRKALDTLTVGASLGGALSMLVLLALLILLVTAGAWLAMKTFGWEFFTDSRWQVNKQHLGAWPMMYGTLVTATIALVIAVPVAVGSAVFLVRLGPTYEGQLVRWGPMKATIGVLEKVKLGKTTAGALLESSIRNISNLASFLIELLASIPSIAYGFWGTAVMLPILQETLNPFLERTLGKLPYVGEYFTDAHVGKSLFAAGIILSIMVTPIITAITRDVLKSIPPELEQGAYGLGATWWQATKVVLSSARMGIFGAVVLGLARALGETMAVTMVIGSTISHDRSILGPGESIASILATKFRDSEDDLQTSALVYCALALLVITLVINTLARVMINRSVAKGSRR